MAFNLVAVAAAFTMLLTSTQDVWPLPDVGLALAGLFGTIPWIYFIYENIHERHRWRPAASYKSDGRG